MGFRWYLAVAIGIVVFGPMIMGPGTVRSCFDVGFRSGVSVAVPKGAEIDRFCLQDDCVEDARRSTFLVMPAEEAEYEYDLAVTTENGQQWRFDGEVETRLIDRDSEVCGYPITANAEIRLAEDGELRLEYPEWP